MPQNAIIRANGTGDYTTLAAWEAAEQNSDYGSITIGRVDGFFDLGTGFLAISGTWINGAQLEPFDSADGFDGTERQLCGLTSSNTNRAIRGQTSGIILNGLEVYLTSTGTGRTLQGDAVGNITANDCLIHSTASRSIQTVETNNCVLVTMIGSTGNPMTGTCVLNNSSVFTDSTQDMGNAATVTANDTVSVNAGTGADWDAGVTQSNNASTDTTADTLDNIVVADEFVSATPVASGDYRILSTGDLALNGIGAFIQSGGGGGTLTADTGAYLYTGANADLLTSRILTANSGTYNYTGTSVSLVKGLMLNADTGNYTYSGTDVTLTFTPVGAAVLVADSGSYVYTGADIGFNRNRVIIAATGSYSYNGTDIQFIVPGQIWTDKPTVSTTWINQDATVTNWTNQTPTSTIWTDK